MNIRRCAPDDALAVHAMEAESIECPWSLADIEQAIRNGYVYLIAEDAGYGGMRVVFTDAEITNIAVRPRMRRKGVAAAILSALTAEAERAGADRMLLEVNEGNTAARRLYEKCGFKEIAKRKNYYKSETAIVMEKVLRSGNYADRSLNRN